MIGQNRLQTTLRNFGFSRLPQTILLVGEKGSGKHTLVKEMASFYKVNLIDLTDSVDLNTLLKVSERMTRTFYLFNLDDLDERRQNVLLKFLEEPVATAYIFLLSSDTSFVLPTVLSRCVRYDFEKYTREQLKGFIQSNDERPLDLCETPGQVMTFNKYTVDDLYDLCDKIITMLPKASIGSTLNIENKINFSDDYDKIDFDILLNTLEIRILKFYKENNGDLDFMYKALNRLVLLKTYARDSRIDKKTLIKSFLLDLWEMSRGMK